MYKRQGINRLFPERGGEDTAPPEESRAVGTITFKDPQNPKAVIDRENNTLRPRENEVRYNVLMHISWSEVLHPGWYPSSAHLSPMVAWSHRVKDVVFKEGEVASEGIEVMAETGGTDELREEIQNIGERGFILHYDIGKVIDAPGEDTTTILLSNEARYASIVSMIAPSPDWFVAVHNVELFNGNSWYKRKAVPAVLYDAGTDNGKTFSAWNSDTDPPKPITLLPNAPPVPLVTFEFQLVE